MTKVQSLVDRLRVADGEVVPYHAVKLMQEAADELERLSRPWHEREPPHCPTCGCDAAECFESEPKP